jgi:hypothetical protein
VGIKKLEEWNCAAIMRHIWSLFVTVNSLWVVWVEAILLKGRLLAGGISQVCTWNWRKLLKLRNEARHFIKFYVGDDSKIHMWFDDWRPNGALHSNYRPRIVYDTQSKLDAQLSTVINDRQWM